MCGDSNSNKCEIDYNVLLNATPVKNFSDAYTLTDDWKLEDKLFYNNDISGYSLIANPPSFLLNRNLCGVFDLSAKIVIKNKSNQDISYPKFIMPSICSTYNLFVENCVWYYVYENQNFLILIQTNGDSIVQNPNITTYTQGCDGTIYYHPEQYLDDTGILHFDCPLKAKMTTIINANIHIYVKNHSNDFLYNTLFYGHVCSAKNCSCSCLKQSALPLVDNSVITLNYDSGCC